MTQTIQLSKSQYLKGLQCPLSLWLAFYRRDIEPEQDPAREARLKEGREIGEWAKKLFPGGAEVKAAFFDPATGAAETRQLADAGKTIIFEATAIHPGDKSHARADILQKVAGTDSWDIIEVKGTTGVEDYHIDDVAFQYRVFMAAGYNIRGCFLMHINNQYVRQGDISPSALFLREDVTQTVLNNLEHTEQTVAQLLKLSPAHESKIEISKARCTKPFECAYTRHCWRDVPKHSIFDVLRGQKANDMVSQLGSYEIKSLPATAIPSGAKKADVLSHISNKVHVDKKNLEKFLQRIRYPLYYLDYETVRYGVPLFDDSRPYQQIPFQFSLHIEEEPGAELKHHSFLHQKRSDPRPAFIEALINLCGDHGTVVVYNQTFEETVNKQLADYQPMNGDEILAINSRMIDLYDPFQKRWLYHPQQHGSASIKSVLPAFTDLSYETMDISNGDDASQQYLQFIKNGLNTEAADLLWQNLGEYCKLDTFAMKVLLDIVAKHVA